MNNGWIKLHRKILDNPKFEDGDYFTIWIKLLLFATHQEKTALFKGKEIILKPGQLITGRKFLGVNSRIAESKVQRVLKWLENAQQIEQQTTNKNRLITILNWDKYQDTEQQNEQLLNNKRTTSEQQVNTYKNVKNDNKIYSEDSASQKKPTHNPLGADIIKAFEEVNPACKTYYANKTQRSACDFLIEQYTLEKVLGVIGILNQIKGRDYFPTITTPLQLKEKWSALEVAIRRESNKDSKLGNVYL